MSLTHELAAITGRLRDEPEDFLVEEILSYAPSGAGTHVWFEIEKRGLTSFEAIRRIARELGRRENEIGCAGLKDKRAVTRQTLSLEFADEAKLAALAIPGIEVRSITRHKNKLKLGHLRANRFTLRIHGTLEGDLERARRKLELLEKRGLPNLFGDQRFGRNRATPRLGQALLAGQPERFLRIFAGAEEALDAAADSATTDPGTTGPATTGTNACRSKGAGPSPQELLATQCSKDPLVRRALETWQQRGKADAAVRSLPRRFLSLCVSALQSEIFNEVLMRRLAELSPDAVHVLEDGDIAYLHRNGACFTVNGAEELAVARERGASFEISPSGPLPGPSCLRAQGSPGELEDAVLAEFSLNHDFFAPKRPWAQKGARRALRVPIEELSVTATGDSEAGAEQGLELCFVLPKGSFATALSDELFAGPTER